MYWVRLDEDSMQSSHNKTQSEKLPVMQANGCRDRPESTLPPCHERASVQGIFAIIARTE